jgi:hypothetical protein
MREIGVVIREDAKPGVVVLPWSAEGTRKCRASWSFCFKRGHGGECPNFCVRGARRLVHGGGRSALATYRPTDAVGKSVAHITRWPS